MNEDPALTQPCPEAAAREVQRETHVHGARWSAQFRGYFSNPLMAAPLWEAIESVLAEAPPRVIADLGGGTGFILAGLRQRGRLAPGIRLVDIDLSADQLAQARAPGLETLCRSLLEFTRAEIAGADERVLFLTRSTLHYAGLFGLKPMLQHWRNQARPGEYLVQQTVCSPNPEEALLNSELLERLHSSKWMPPLRTLEQACEQTGWEVRAVAPAPSLLMESHDLQQRYRISDAEMRDVRARLAERYAAQASLRITPDGFEIDLPYRILICRAQ